MPFRSRTLRFRDRPAAPGATTVAKKGRHVVFRANIADQKPPRSKLQSRAFREILATMTAEPSAAAPVRSSIHPAVVHAALGNKLRWEMMGMMADGKTLTAREASRTLRQDVNTIMKHLRLLRRLGLIEAISSDQDARYLFYYIPERWRPQPGVFDCAGCTARFPVR